MKTMTFLKGHISKKIPPDMGGTPLCGVYAPKHLGISHELVKPHRVGCFLLTK
jgi:hypothetical protein